MQPSGFDPDGGLWTATGLVSSTSRMARHGCEARVLPGSYFCKFHEIAIGQEFTKAFF